MTRAFDHIQYCPLVDPKFWLLSLIKERPIWTDFQKYFLVHVLSDNVFHRTRDIPFLPDYIILH
jgi:hypothetical protein